MCFYCTLLESHTVIFLFVDMQTVFIHNVEPNY